MGLLGALSFHETKNVISGEGGALLVNDGRLIDRAEILLEKGTNRSRFLRGEVDKYTWIDIGGSYPPSEIVAAFLWAQLERAEEITQRRLDIWWRYHDAFAQAEAGQLLRRPVVPQHTTHNAHMYYVLLPNEWRRDRFINDLAGCGVHAVFHYVPLHSSEAGRRFGQSVGDLRVTEQMSARLVRLPLWTGMTDDEVAVVIDAVLAAVGVDSRRPLRQS
jgi:dTDP-4-amino-4,6-dideoxygalactose transaminase